MQFLDNYRFKTLKYELINKFTYTSTKKIPKLQKIILNFGCNNTNIKSLSSSLLTLEIVTQQKGILNYSKKANITLKIRKGNPVGCSVTLRKKQMFQFLHKIQIEVLPRLKNFEGFDFKNKYPLNTFFFSLTDIFTFNGLDNNYYLFNNLTSLNIAFVANSSTNKELFFILESLQLPKK
jgi:large subunit ribosomal protein L5